MHVKQRARSTHLTHSLTDGLMDTIRTDDCQDILGTLICRNLFTLQDFRFLFPCTILSFRL